MSSANAKPNEPTMEEILASIRRIISDDQEPAKPAAKAPPPPPVEDDVLDLAEVVEPKKAPGKPAADEISFADDGKDMDFDMLDMDEEPEPPPPPPPPRSFGGNDASRLLSLETDSSVSHAFNLLAHTVLTNNARTLEDLVREMLRPMLKMWLDDNLPPMVERLVRAEIERVARGGR
jgi:cell pole-organizing protein PopZ